MGDRKRFSMPLHAACYQGNYEVVQLLLGQRGIELDNLAESLYRGLMICYREMGDHAEALRVYRRCRELLSIVLSVQPAAETQAVYEGLKHT